MIPADDPQYCPICQCSRPVMWGAYGALRCRICGAPFTLSESIRAKEKAALKTVAEVAAKVPREDNP